MKDNKYAAKWTKENLQEIAGKSNSITDMCRVAGSKTRGGNVTYFSKLIKNMI